VVNLYSDDDPDTARPYFDQLYMSNYATIRLKDAVAGLEGVGDVTIIGQQDYSMWVWLDPDKLLSRNLTVGDVIQVLREQNVQVAAGQVGQPPVPTGQDFQYTLTTLGRLAEPGQCRAASGRVVLCPVDLGTAGAVGVCNPLPLHVKRL
jgi:multidrug efflux pump subunit AcrB